MFVFLDPFLIFWSRRYIYQWLTVFLRVQLWSERKFKTKLIKLLGSQSRYLLFLFIWVSTPRMVKELELCSKHHITSIFRNTIYRDPYLDWIIIELQFRFAYINFLQNVHRISFFFSFCSCQLDFNRFAWFNKNCSRYTSLSFSCMILAFLLLKCVCYFY